ncbi:hypothetical protein LOAG_13935 [Loa loa]|uniref:Uncharacterized protein n=1 Tax=Loa loa TaxID=7209 RepID=A0A1S0TJ39_LOALO|nr:hypothetical protein LOAG_13935 [Loa loa]EFO14582.1 hypothetical protein LOAG_13935 [Loa loa]
MKKRKHVLSLSRVERFEGSITIGGFILISERLVISQTYREKVSRPINPVKFARNIIFAEMWWNKHRMRQLSDFSDMSEAYIYNFCDSDEWLFHNYTICRQHY